jgi:hypothetical protein
MDNITIRKEIHQYIDEADERFLNLIYGMIRADQEEVHQGEISSEEIQLIEDRLAEYEKIPGSGSGWEDVEKRMKG